MMFLLMVRNESKTRVSPNINVKCLPFVWPLQIRHGENVKNGYRQDRIFHIRHGIYSKCLGPLSSSWWPNPKAYAYQKDASGTFRVKIKTLHNLRHDNNYECQNAQLPKSRGNIILLGKEFPRRFEFQDPFLCLYMIKTKNNVICVEYGLKSQVSRIIMTYISGSEISIENSEDFTEPTCVRPLASTKYMRFGARLVRRVFARNLWNGRQQTVAQS